MIPEPDDAAQPAAKAEDEVCKDSETPEESEDTALVADVQLAEIIRHLKD